MKDGKKIGKNIGWLMFDSFFILFLQFVVGIKVANFYGATLYGKYNYAASLIAFSAIFFELINGRVIKKFYTDESFDKVVYNVNLFRNTLAIVLFFVPIAIQIFVPMDSLLFYMLLLMAFDNILVTSTSGIENFFEFKLESKRIVISNNIVKILSYSLQYLCIYLHIGIIMIPAIRCIGNFIRMCLLKYQYRKDYLSKVSEIQKKKDRFDKSLIFKMIDESKFLWITFISFLVYTQIDKLMIEHYLGVAQVGVYTIGVQLSIILSILIGPVQNSIFPKMLELHREDMAKYRKFYLYINSGVTQFYLFATLLSIAVVKVLFKYVYAPEYNGAIMVYSILAFSILVKANASLQTGHMTIRNITKKSFYKSFLGLLINIVLNMVLIQKYGVNGAAIATLLTQIIALFVIDFFIPEYREHAMIQLKSYNTLLFGKMLYNRLRKK